MADIGTLNPEQMLQQQQILRQQKMAEMLMQQGMQQPQGQMVSGRYVAPSIFQNLAGLANLYVGQQGIKEADQAQIDLAKAIRGQEGVALADYMSQLQGRPAKPAPAGYELGDAGTPAVAGNPMLANMNALQNPNSPAFLRQFAMGEIIKKPKWEKAEYTDPKTGVTRQGVIDVNSPNPISTFQVGGTKPEMTAAERIGLNMRGAELLDKGIGGFGGYGGGQPTGVSMGQPQSQLVSQPAPKADPYAPATLPKYEYDPALTPAQNRDQALAFSKENQNLVKNAKNSFDLLKSTAETLRTGNPSSGRGENIITGAREFFGGGGETSKADAILTIYGTKLTQQVPRFEGPQSDKDTALYQAAAGDVGNPNKPIATRLAAVETMIDLNKKYYPKGDWASIDTKMPTQPSASSIKAFGSAKEVDFNSLPTGRR